MNNNFNKPRSIINKDSINDNFNEINMSSKETLRELARQNFPELYINEIPLNQVEIDNINIINKKLDSFVKKYQNDVFPLDIKDVHKVSSETLANFMKSPHTSALYEAGSHQVYFREGQNPIVLFSHMQHEMVHSKSMTLFEKRLVENNKNLAIRQNGVMSTDSKYLYLENLNEAITEYVSKKVTQQLIGGTEFQKNKENMISKINLERSFKGFPIKNSSEVVSFEVTNEVGVRFVEHAYPVQRHFFEIILEDIQKKNPDVYKTKEDAEDVFFKAYFGGDLAFMEQVVDQTYGSGTLEKFKLIDRRKHAETSDLQKKGFTLISLIESIKSDAQS